MNRLLGNRFEGVGGVPLWSTGACRPAASRQHARADSRGLGETSGGQGAKDDLLHYPPHGLAHRRKAGVPLGGKFVVFTHPPFAYPDAAVQEISLFQGMQQRVKASRADVITQVAQILAQSAAVKRRHTRLVEDNQFYHALPQCLGDLLLITIYPFMIYIG